MLNKKGKLWQYLSTEQKSLIQQGLYLLDDIKSHTPTHQITDYSFLVFSFAKAYEGFLKQFFLDLGFISQKHYHSDYFRIGKALSPHLVKRLKNDSVYAQLTAHFGNHQLADELWSVWKQGRNRVFHYFPHNVSALSLVQAEKLIRKFISAMEKAVEQGNVNSKRL